MDLARLMNATRATEIPIMLSSELPTPVENCGSRSNIPVRAPFSSVFSTIVLTIRSGRILGVGFNHPLERSPDGLVDYGVFLDLPIRRTSHL